jgi:hypothetical protein
MNCRGFDTLRALHALFLSGDLRKHALFRLRDLQSGRYAEIRRPEPPAKIDLSSLIAACAPSPVRILIAFPVRIFFGLWWHVLRSLPCASVAIHQ